MNNKTYKLGDICKIISGKDTKNKQGKIPLVSSSGILGFTSKFRVENSSISLPRVGTMKIFYYNFPVWNINTSFLIYETNKKIVNKKFLYFKLKSFNDWKKIIENTTRPLTKISDWKNLKINLPPLEEQQKIIDIIEPNEKLFLKYFNCIRINSFENTKIDTKKIIDIIEPLEELENKIEILKNKILNFIKKLPKTKKVTKLQNLVFVLKNKPKLIKQVSAKVLNKKDVFINKFENKNTYKTNTFFVSKKTLLINKIRTYLNKFAITPDNCDVNGTVLKLNVIKHETSILNNLLNNHFWNKTNLLSTGTKMPVIKSKDLLEININLLKYEINNIFDFLICLNNLKLKIKIIKNKNIKLLII